MNANNGLTNNQRAISECRGTVMTGPQAVDAGLIAAPLGNTGFNIAGNTFCTQDFNNEFTALPRTERVGFLGRGTKVFSPTVEAYAELGLSQVKTQQIFQDPFFAATTGLQPTSSGLRPFTYNVIFAPGVAGNPFATNARYQGVLGDLGTRNTDIKSNTGRFLVGAKYEIAGFDFDSGLSYSKNEVTAQNSNRLSKAGVSAVFGVPSGVQPPIPVSTATNYNLDRFSSNSQAVRDAMRINFPRKSDSELTSFDTRLSKEFGKLPGGPIGVAAGLEVRKEKLNDKPDPAAQAGDILGQGITKTDGSRNNSALFTELSLPVLKSLEAQLAVRYDHYSDFGNATTPKVGLKYKPISSVLLRANWGRGFRAPTLPEISPSIATFFTSVTDTCAGVPAGSPCPNQNQITQISGVFAGNPSLQAEKSTSTTFGVVFEPTSDFSAGLNWYEIDWRNRVQAPRFQSIVNAGGPNVIRDPSSGIIVTVLNNYINKANTTTRGVDLDFKAATRTAIGKFTLRGDLAYVDTFKEDGYEAAGNNGGSNTIPRVKANLALDYDSGPLSLTGRVNYTHHFRQDGLPGSWFTPQDPRFQNGTYPENQPSYRTYDLFGSYDVTKNLKLSASILNVTNETPAYDPGFSGTFLYDFSLYDVRGRQYRLGLNYKIK